MRSARRYTRYTRMPKTQHQELTPAFALLKLIIFVGFLIIMFH